MAGAYIPILWSAYLSENEDWYNFVLQTGQQEIPKKYKAILNIRAYEGMFLLAFKHRKCNLISIL